MEFDFLVTTSWPRVDVEKTQLWANELARRGHTVGYLSPADRELPSLVDDVRRFSFPSLVRSGVSPPSPSEVEDRFDVPSLPLVCHAERELFGLSQRQGIERACALASGLRSFFSEHSVAFGFQNRGPEIHRLLTHHAITAEGGRSVWVDFSPFEEEFALSTSVRGEWDVYRTIPYDEMSAADREETRAHIDTFRERQRFYSHSESAETSTVSKFVSKARAALASRDRPGTRRRQAVRRLAIQGRRRVNAALLPTLRESRRRCRDTEYVFFPLQYPIESRLTIFSPQYFRQEYVVEYLSRALPASVELFVKPHPNHPGRPSPSFLHTASRSDRIQFLQPAMNAHEVIRGAAAVVVTNNTVGFETLYHGKPLLTLGQAPYAATPAAVDVSDLGDLSQMLSEHVFTDIPEITTVESVFSLRKASFRGDRTSLEDREVRTLVDSAEEFVAKVR